MSDDVGHGHGRSRQVDLVGFGEEEFFEIVAVAAAVDDEEILGVADRRQHAVPEVAGIVHALAGAVRKACGVAGPPFSSGQTTTRKGRGDSGMKAWLPSGWRSTMASVSGKLVGRRLEDGDQDDGLPVRSPRAGRGRGSARVLPPLIG